MATFPRTIMPNGHSLPRMSGPLTSIAESGVMQTRSTTRVGRTWAETFFFQANEAGVAFITDIENWFRNGTQLDVVHQGRKTLFGAGGGVPLVNGADQTGSTIDTDGWPNSTLVLKKGDLVTFAGITLVYDIAADATTNGSGEVTLSINPPIFSGGSPANNAAITVTDSVVWKMKIIELDVPVFGPDEWVSVQLRLQEDP